MKLALFASCHRALQVTIQIYSLPDFVQEPFSITQQNPITVSKNSIISQPLTEAMLEPISLTIFYVVGVFVLREPGCILS